MASLRWGRLALAALAAAVSLARSVPPAAAAEIGTSIDLSYTYDQERIGDDVDANVTYNQKYEVKYQTSLSSSFDFIGAVRLELDDAWHSDAAGTTKVAPTLEMDLKGGQAGFKASYAGVISTTDAWNENSESTTYSNNLDAELQLTPRTWPETRIKLQRRRDYQELRTESTRRSFELQTKKDISDLRLEFNFKREQSDKTLPTAGVTEQTDWGGKATYKNILYAETEFELSYEIKESYSEDTLRGVFVGDNEDYTQDLKTRLKKPFELTPRLKFSLSWEYQYKQDLIGVDGDYEFSNKYLAEARYDLLSWAKLAAEVRRETSQTVNPDGRDREGDVKDAAKLSADLDPVPWLKLGGKVEAKRSKELGAESGRSFDLKDEEKYEGVAKNHLGEFWDLTVNVSGQQAHTDGWLTAREGKFKSELRLKLFDLSVTPSYELSRNATWEPRRDDSAAYKRNRDMKIKFEYRRQFLDLLQATFSHEYGIRYADELDEVLDFERTVTLDEGTRINFVLAEFVQDLRIEAEVDRKGSDTGDDPDPMLVDVAYSLKFDYKLSGLSLSASLKYNDKGDAFDDLTFNAKIGWKGEHLDFSGEYQFDKIYADDPEEKRKLGLKLNYKF